MAKKDAMTEVLPGELVPFSDLIKQIAGRDDIEVEMIIVGANAGYWAPEKGAWIHGTLVNRFEVATKYGPVGLYTVRVANSVNAQTRDGEVFQTKPGDLISVLERAMLKHLAAHVGKEIVVRCEGESETHDGQTLWNYTGAVVNKRSPGGTQARV